MPLLDRTRALPAWLQGAALVLLALAAHAPSLANGYVSDDEFYIRGVQELASLEGLRDIWLRLGAVPQYYPLVHTAFWIEYRLWGLDPVGFHAINLATHAAVVVLAWRLLRRLALPGAWLAAAVFAVHPVHVETVAWASERKNLLSMAFALGALLAWLRFAPLDATPASPRRRSWYALSLVLYAAALLCKTVVVTTPAVLGVLLWWKNGRLERRQLLALVPFLAIGLPLALVTIWVEREHVGARGVGFDLGPLDRVLIAGRAVWFYLGKLAWPHPLGFVYPRWDVDPRALGQWAYPIGVAALAAALFLARGRIGRGPLAALLLFVGILFPALGFFDVYPHLFSFVADHYQYHASLAPIALAAAGAAIGLARAAPSAQIAGGAALVAALALLGGIAHRETGFYRDDETLIRRSVANQPGAWSARFRMAGLLASERRYEEAVAEMRAALALFPSYTPMHVAVASYLTELGRLDEAERELETALAGALDPDDRFATAMQLGNLRVAQRRADAAAPAFRAATELAPESAEAHYALGLVLRETGDRTGAVAALRRSVALDPDVAKSQYALGTVLLEAGDAKAAIAPLERALALEPAHAPAAAALERARVAR